MSSSLLLDHSSSLLLKCASTTLDRQDGMHEGIAVDAQGIEDESSNARFKPSWWLVLPLAAAYGGFYCAGLIGGALVSALMIGLERKKRAQLIAAGVLVPVLFLSGTVFRAANENVQKHQLASQQLVAPPAAPTGGGSEGATSTATSDTASDQFYAQAHPAPPPGYSYESSDKALVASWDQAAIAFEAAHPELKLGANEQVMQEAINRLVSPTLSDGDLLQQAYGAARLDPRWKNPAALNDPGAVTWDDAK